MALSEMVYAAAAIDVEAAASASIPLSGATLSALGRFVHQDVGAWLMQPGKKPLLRQMRESMDLWRRYRFAPYQYLQSDLYLRHVGEDYRDFIPTYLADEYCVEVNKAARTDWLEDKLEFDRRMRDMDLPYVPVIALLSIKGGALSASDADGAALSLGQLFDLAKARSRQRIFVKPRFGVQGLGAFALHLGADGFEREGKPFGAAALQAHLASFPFDEYVVQPFFHQHETLQTLNPTSVNTVRVMTLRSGDDVDIFCTYLKAGAGDRETDNGSYGGYSAGACLKTGAVISPGKIYEAGQSRSGDVRHCATGVEFMSLKIPYAQEIAELSIRGTRMFAPIRLIGWDIAIGPDGPCVIEANIHPGFRGVQDICGGLRHTSFGREIAAVLNWR